MRIEIHLIMDVADIENLDIVLDQCQRDNQGRQSSMISITPESSAFS